MARYRFSGACEFDSASRDVHRHDFVTRLERQPAALLALLANRAGEVVTYDEIRSVVGRKNTRDIRECVHSCVKQIRAALGDRAHAPRVIETIPGRGYRLKRAALLAAPKRGASRHDAPAGPEREGNLRSRSPRWI
jgi:DNA-binding winged helix-turn-helix (wHTH) protein